MTPATELARLLAFLDSGQPVSPEQRAASLAAVQAPRNPRQAALDWTTDAAQDQRAE